MQADFLPASRPSTKPLAGIFTTLVRNWNTFKLLAIIDHHQLYLGTMPALVYTMRPKSYLISADQCELGSVCLQTF